MSNGLQYFKDIIFVFERGLNEKYKKSICEVKDPSEEQNNQK